MSRGAQAWWTALGSALGLGVGIAGGRLATSGMQDSSARANIVLGSAVAGAAAGGAIGAYATSGKLLPAASSNA